MTTEQVLYTDCRTKEGKEQLQNILYKLPPYKRYADKKTKIPLEALEKLIYEITDTYAITVQWFHYSSAIEEDRRYWSAPIKENISHKMIVNITSCSLYELTAKLSFALYALKQGWRSEHMKKANLSRIITREKAILMKGKYQNEN